jgi:hypothetical protein
MKRREFITLLGGAALIVANPLCCQGLPTRGNECNYVD